MENLPLSGVRVVDLSRVFAMPYCGAHLADMGAEVIKVDTCQAQFMDTTRLLNGPYPDNEAGPLYWETAGTFQTLNRGKRSLTLDLRDARAVSILKDLVAVSDVVIENFTPRVMRRFGLDYPNLRAARPDLIMVSNTGYGHSGPWSDFGAMASALEPTHGSGAFSGYLEPGPDGRLGPGSVPNKLGNSYSDFLASWMAQFSILACLLYRARTGRGVWIDLAMYQVGAAFFGEGILDFFFNGRRARRLGNRHQYMAPHGCYPCRGVDQWVTLAARDDTEWRSLCRVMGQPELAADPRFADPVSRHKHQDALDEIIVAWTKEQEGYAVMDKLQGAGIPAGPALNARQLLADPHFRARGYFEAVEHPPETGLGRREYISRGWKLSASPVRMRRPAPMLGEANNYSLQELLGLTPEELTPLKEAKIIGDTIDGGRPPVAVPLSTQVERGWIAGYDRDYKGV